MRSLAAVGLAAAVLVVAPLAAGHAAPPPAGYETRLLHDCNDDYFGGDAVGAKNGHDLIALDLQERFDPGLGDVIVFKLIMNGGFGGSGSPTLKDELTFKVGPAAKTYSWTTTDNQRFTGNFDRIGGPSQVYTQQGSPDGERFFVTGTLALSSLGADVGSKLSDFRVASYVDGNRRDYMPGGYDTAAGPDPLACRGDTTAFQRPDYAIEGPTMYSTLGVSPAQATLASGSERLINLDVKNSLKDRPQTFRLTAVGGQGVDWSFHNPATDTYEKTFEGDLVENGQTLVHPAVTGGEPGVSGTLTVTLTTDLGGRVVRTFAYTVANAGGGAQTSPTTDMTDGAAADGGKAPGFGLVAALVGVTVMAMAGGRRRP